MVLYRYRTLYSTLTHLARIARPVSAHSELAGARPIDSAHSTGYVLAGLSIGQAPLPPF